MTVLARISSNLTDGPNELVVRESPACKNVSMEAKCIVRIRQKETTGDDIAK
jgi:hypothetical protein